MTYPQTKYLRAYLPLSPVVQALERAIAEGGMLCARHGWHGMDGMGGIDGGGMVWYGMVGMDGIGGMGGIDGMGGMGGMDVMDGMGNMPGIMFVFYTSDSEDICFWPGCAKPPT